MLGMKQEYQHLPHGSLLYAKMWEQGLQTSYVGAEASLIFANRYKMRGPIKQLGGRIYTTYRNFETKLWRHHMSKLPPYGRRFRETSSRACERWE